MIKSNEKIEVSLGFGEQYPFGEMNGPYDHLAGIFFVTNQGNGTAALFSTAKTEDKKKSTQSSRLTHTPLKKTVNYLADH
jgi:hypothetical protein